ncbi:pilus assembly FimT family protein [Photobacterium arenosum]|uniref:pilus assembly FimT family protein n=1 Tax=Photobacterium arenosum TaxID=2774143 RepID=UPI00288A353C|nr:GspH/FimT family pseudopilin [Photobacterium arenosum]
MRSWESATENMPLRQMRLHCVASVRGMTLIEAIVVLSVIMLIATVATPSFSDVFATQRLHRLVSELEWLLVLAKSEAVMRGEDVSIGLETVPHHTVLHHTVLHHTMTTSQPGSDDWIILARLADGEPVLKPLSAADFPHLTLSRSFASDVLTVDSLTGRPHAAGSFFVGRDGKSQVRITFSNVTGRVYVCSLSAEAGYARC